MSIVRRRVNSYVLAARFRLTRRLPDRQPADVWPGIEETMITSGPFMRGFGNLKYHELSTLCAVARYTRVRSIFEFGTFDGLTAWHLAVNCGPEARIRTIDLPLDHPARTRPGHDRAVGKIAGITVGRYFHGTSEANRIEQIYCDTMEFDPSPLAGAIDLCFVDASHEYRHVSRDTENALRLTRPGGIIFWHDYSKWWPGVQKCLDDLSGRLPLFRIPGTSLAAVHLPD